MAESTVTTYTTALGVWRRSGAVHILSVHDTKIASFPISFLHSCGDDSWSYILRVVSLLIEVDLNHPGQLRDDHGQLVNLRDPPNAGEFRYVEDGAFADYFLVLRI